MGVILLVENDDALKNDLSNLFSENGFSFLTAATAETALQLLQCNPVQLIISELNAPGIDGTQFMRQVRQLGTYIPFIFLRNVDGASASAAALREGAEDALVKPVAPDELLVKVQCVLDRHELRLQNSLLKREVDGHLRRREFVGVGMPFEQTKSWIEKAAVSRLPALIYGEPGTGKATIARMIHSSSNAKQEPFILVRCRVVSEHALDTELFGHSNGHGDGFRMPEEGLLRVARKGTLFFEEVSALPLALQSRLIAVIEAQREHQNGSKGHTPFSARIIASSSRPLSPALQACFSPLELNVLPLRERREDVAVLAVHFLSRFNTELHRHFEGIEENALRGFATSPWKGNIRELQNIIERAMMHATEPILRAQDLMFSQKPVTQIAEMKELKDAVSVFERDHIRRIIAERHGDKRAAARDLGISLSSLYRHLDLKGPV